MASKQRETETMNISEVRSQLNKLVNRVYREETRVIVEKSGIPVAGLVSPEDVQRLRRLEAEDRDLWSVVDEMREAFKDVPQEEIEQEAARSVAEVREEMRAEREQPVVKT